MMGSGENGNCCIAATFSSIIRAYFTALQPGVVIDAAFRFGEALSGEAVSRGFNIETVTAGLEPCN